MRPVHLALLVLAALAPSFAQARPWQGIQPGVSTQREVVERFGEPATRAKRGARTVLAYHGERAPAGTRQAQFHVDGAEVVQEITIFLTVQLDAESVEGTYGKPPQRTFVEDTFQKVWLYPAAGRERLLRQGRQRRGAHLLCRQAGPRARGTRRRQPARTPRLPRPRRAH